MKDPHAPYEVQTVLHTSKYRIMIISCRSSSSIEKSQTQTRVVLAHIRSRIGHNLPPAERERGIFDLRAPGPLRSSGRGWRHWLLADLRRARLRCRLRLLQRPWTAGEAGCGRWRAGRKLVAHRRGRARSVACSRGRLWEWRMDSRGKSEPSFGAGSGTEDESHAWVCTLRR